MISNTGMPYITNPHRGSRTMPKINHLNAFVATPRGDTLNGTKPQPASGPLGQVELTQDLGPSI